LSAPIAGILTRADAEVPGVNVAATTTYTIVDPDSLIFEIEIDEADIGKLRPDQVVKITLDSYPDLPITTTITSIDFTSHTNETGGNVFTVTAELPIDAGYDYRVGMSGEAEVILAQSKFTNIISITSLIDDTYVYVKKGSTFEKRKVTVGLRNDTEAQIIGGLKEGEEVALLPTEVPEEKKKAEEAKKNEKS
jgi:HlyD family secretion protein